MNAMIPSQDELLDLVAEEALIDRAKLAPDASISALGIDSVDTATVLFALEEKYGVLLETDDLSPEMTLGQLCALVQDKAGCAA
jgi:acyl carrier protein